MENKLLSASLIDIPRKRHFGNKHKIFKIIHWTFRVFVNIISCLIIWLIIYYMAGVEKLRNWSFLIFLFMTSDDLEFRSWRPFFLKADVKSPFLKKLLPRSFKFSWGQTVRKFKPKWFFTTNNWWSILA